MNLQDFADPLATEAAFYLLCQRDPDYPLGELGRVTLELSERLRALGIILLLTRADSDGFFHNLIRSARARQAWLARVHARRAFDEHHYASGRYQPLLDAIAADELVMARDITAVSPGDWQQQREYEDDFCYAQILHRLLGPFEAAEIAALLVRWKSWLDGQHDPRWPLCAAVAHGAQDDFDEAFEDLLDAWERNIAEQKRRGQLEEPHVVAQRLVNVEALAWLRLAEKRGLRTRGEYRGCPSLARVPLVQPFPGE